MLSRRTALRGGTAVAVGMVVAPLAAVPLRATAEDGDVFGLVEEWWQQLKSEHAALSRILEAIQPFMPPGIQTTEDAMFLAEGRAALTEAFQRPEIVALCTEHDQQQETRRGLGDRLAETPANTLEGINAKLKVAMRSGRNTDIARSAANDLDRMMREG